MWNPLNPEYQSVESERQTVAVFFACVANKRADVVWRKLIGLLDPDRLPFDQLERLHSRSHLMRTLLRHRLAPYDQVYHRLLGLVREYREYGEDWRYENLIGHGFGPKTRNCIGLYAFDADVAGLDVHVRRWLEARGYSGSDDRLSEDFLREAEQRGLRPWQLDREVWMEGFLSSRSSQTPSGG